MGLKPPISTNTLNFEVASKINKGKWYLHCIPFPWKHSSRKKCLYRLYTFLVMISFLIFSNGCYGHLGYKYKLKNYFCKIVPRVRYYVYAKIGLNQFNKMEVLPKYAKIITCFSNKSENANIDCHYDVIGRR
jgi:hypothetical protein